LKLAGHLDMHIDAQAQLLVPEYLIVEKSDVKARLLVPEVVIVENNA
jgi:hypothetical protein